MKVDPTPVAPSAGWSVASPALAHAPVAAFAFRFEVWGARDEPEAGFAPELVAVSRLDVALHGSIALPRCGTPLAGARCKK